MLRGAGSFSDARGCYRPTRPKWTAAGVLVLSVRQGVCVLGAFTAPLALIPVVKVANRRSGALDVFAAIHSFKESSDSELN
jgi:hypothetical protein